MMKDGLVANTWNGILTEFHERLQVPEPHHITLGEGGTPLVHSRVLSAATHCDVYIKVEAMNPTGSFKDRGMAVAISMAASRGHRAVTCASTGNTAASAAAYAIRAGMTAYVVVPAGNIAPGKMAQSAAYGAQVIEIEGSFDDSLRAVTSTCEELPVTLVNSINPDRILGQQSAAWEIASQLGRLPDIHALPVGNAGNITAYHAGFLAECHNSGVKDMPKLWGFQAAGAAPFVKEEFVETPETIATAIRIGKPASWDAARRAVKDTDGRIESVTDSDILAAQRTLATRDGIFVEPASAAPVAGLLNASAAGAITPGQLITVTVTGNGLKDPQWAIQDIQGRSTFSPRHCERGLALADMLAEDFSHKA